MSHSDYWEYIRPFYKKDYQIQLNFLCLDRAIDYQIRVMQWVAAGDFNVSHETVEGIYGSNLVFINTNHDYFNLIDRYDDM